MKLRHRGTLVAVILVAALVVVVFRQLWWVPRTAYSCDGLPRGASTPAAAAQEFTTSLIASDTADMCAVMVDKLTDTELAALATDVRDGQCGCGGTTSKGRASSRAGQALSRDNQSAARRSRPSKASLMNGSTWASTFLPTSGMRTFNSPE